MSFDFKFEVILPFITAFIILISITYFLFNRKNALKFYSFLCFQILIFLWSALQTIERLIIDVDNKWRVLQLEYLPISFIGVISLLFICYFTDHSIIKKKKFIAFLFVPPTFFYFAMLTNDYHHLFYITFYSTYSVFGPLFYAHTVISYGYFLAGFSLLTIYIFKSKGQLRMQGLLVFTSLIFPVIANCIQILSKVFINPTFRNNDYTPTSFIIFILIVSVATLKYRFLNVAPLALDIAFSNLKEAVAVVDQENFIVKYNASFNALFSQYSPVKKNSSFETLIKSIENHVRTDESSIKSLSLLLDRNCWDVSSELFFDHNPGMCFSLNIQPILFKENDVLGRIITFNDISEYKALLEDLNQKNLKLLETNDELSQMFEKQKEYNDTLEELTIQRERNRMARDMHDTLGHTMTLLLTQLEVINIVYKKDPKLTGEKIAQTTKIVSDGLNEIKRSIVGLAPERESSLNLVESLEELAAVFDSSNVDVDISFEGKPTVTNQLITESVFRICQEALTNSIRHGKAGKITIIVRFSEEKLTAFIVDNGIGCKSFQKGFGLSGMEKRVSDLKGMISFGSDGENGFNIFLEIPIGGQIRND